MAKTEKKTKRVNRALKGKGRNYRAKQNSTSIYVLLWSVFTVLSLFLVLIFGFGYQATMAQTYKSEASFEVRAKGNNIKSAITAPAPNEFQDNISAYVRFLSQTHDVEVFIFSSSGTLLYPQDSWLPENEILDLPNRIHVALTELDGEESPVVYEGKGEYVYATTVSLYGEDAYLYVGKSLGFIQTVAKETAVRMAFIGLFTFVLTFAVSGAVSAWLTRPLAEMAEKADLLAKGDFQVDFHGYDYGKEMIALAERLNYARDELAKADGMQKELISNVSHDFKTPLTMIKAYASMIVEISGDNPEKRNKHAQVIIDEADRLTLLVNDVLEISKMQAGIEEIHRSTFNLSKYLRETLSRFAYLQDVKGYRFHTEIAESVYTVGDEVKLGQVIYNLIGNAVNYTGEDKQVIVKLVRRDGVARLIVRDTGEGMDKEQLKDIWARYYRSKETHKRPVQGTGLGLAIVKTVLERHGFAFGVDSKEGKGTVFFVDFPLAEDANA